MKATRLRITSLKFISAVDAGAQGPISNVALVKRASSGDEYTLTAKVAKLDEALGVVFGYAVASTVDGGKSPHIDLQGDAVVGGDELIKVALGFAEAGAQSDVMHDCVKDGWVPFVMPLNAETKQAFQLAGDVEGIAIGMKPSAETFKRFQSGELAAFSIFGTGERTPLDEQKRAPVSDEKHRAALDSIAAKFIAEATKSTRSAVAHQRVVTMTLEDATAEIETLKAKLAKAERLALQTDAERQAEIEKSDPVAYRGEVSGITVRKSEATDFAMKLAMAHEAQAVTIAKQKADVAKANEAAEIEKAAREATELRKRAEPMFKGQAGADAAHDAILKAVEACGNADALTSLNAILDAARKGASDASVAKGINPGSDPVEKSAPSEYEELVAKTMADDNCDRPTAADKILKTKRGQELYAAISKSTKTTK